LEIANACAGFSRSASRVAGYVRRMHEAASNCRYRIAIYRASGCYFVQVVDLPGCFTRGATEVEAVENARSAIRAYQWIAHTLAGESATVQLQISA
jgi:hypothetical protein